MVATLATVAAVQVAVIVAVIAVVMAVTVTVAMVVIVTYKHVFVNAINLWCLMTLFSLEHFSVEFETLYGEKINVFDPPLPKRVRFECLILNVLFLITKDFEKIPFLLESLKIP